MENNLINDQHEGQEKEVLHGLSKDRVQSANESFHLSKSKSQRLVQMVDPECTLAAKGTQSDICRKCTDGLPGQDASSLGGHISKHIVSVDEKYLRRFLELIYLSASKAVICNIPIKSSSKMGVLSGSLKSSKIVSEDTIDFPTFGSDCQVSAGSGSLVASPAKRRIVGSIMRSKSMVNILNSPLFRQYGAFDNSANYRSNLNDAGDSTCYDLVGSPGNLSLCSPQKLEKQTPSDRIHKSRPKAVYERIFSTSSTNSSSSDQTSSSTYGFAQGMLQCTWKGGAPSFVFSVDDKKEVYIAKFSKDETANGNEMDLMYLLYSDYHTEHEMHDKESHLVGKIKVSTSFSLCSCNSKIRETEFVLFGGVENYAVETQTSTRNRRKYSGIPKKVVAAFRASPIKHRSISRFSGKNVILEDFSSDPCQDTYDNPESQSAVNLLDDNLPANYELAAIVMKDHLPERQKEEVGGWGLKFLRKPSTKLDIDPLKPLPSECNVRDSCDCSSSMDILIPPGIHGGPRTINGGPSSLTERWKSGGQCDCGGWDMNCPLTFLTTRLNKDEEIPQADTAGECKSFELFIQGSKHCAPSLRMVNVHDGLYLIHFQSALSALQCFSIAVAYFHTRSFSRRQKQCT